MKKWIDVEGKLMDSVEFTRYIRVKTAPEIQEMIKVAIHKERKNRERLQQLQKLS